MVGYWGFGQTASDQLEVAQAAEGVAICVLLAAAEKARLRSESTPR